MKHSVLNKKYVLYHFKIRLFKFTDTYPELTLSHRGNGEGVDHFRLKRVNISHS